MMPLVFKRSQGHTDLHVNPWHIGAWFKDSDGCAVIVVQGNIYPLQEEFEKVNKEIREADAPE